MTLQIIVDQEDEAFRALCREHDALPFEWRKRLAGVRPVDLLAAVRRASRMVRGQRFWEGMP